MAFTDISQSLRIKYIFQDFCLDTSIVLETGTNVKKEGRQSSKTDVERQHLLHILVDV